MTTPILNVVKSKTENGEWDEFSFQRLTNGKPEEGSAPAISFANNIETMVVFGEYAFGDLKVRCCQKYLYEETTESIGLVYTIGDTSIESHGVLINSEATAIPTNREGDAVALSVKLPDDFVDWLYGFESLTW